MMRPGAELPRHGLARVDARLKMALGFSMSIHVVLADSLSYLGLLALVGLAVYLSARPSAFQLKLAFVSVGLLAWGVMFSQGLFYGEYPRTVLLPLLPPNAVMPDGLNIYTEGVYYGLVQSLRMIAVTLTGYAICFTTQPDQFYRGLLTMRVPFSVAFMAVSAIRFIPIVAAEFATVRRAMTMKGYRPFRLGLRDTLATEVASLRPVLSGAIRRSEEVALSIVTRGFAFGRPRTTLHEARLSRGEWGVVAGLLACVLAVGVCKVLFWLYVSEIYYTSSLRGLYQFTRTWL
jgi:energy-coupling factor transport system permease protein